MAKKRVVNGSYVWIGHNGTYALGVHYEGWVFTDKNICIPGKGVLVETELPSFVSKNLKAIRDYLIPPIRKEKCE